MVLPERRAEKARPPLQLTDRQLPPLEAPEPEPEPEPQPEPKPPPEVIKDPVPQKKPVRRQEVPRPAAPEPPAPEPEGREEADAPAADDTGARRFGIEMEGTTAAPSGTGVAVPRGDSLETDPGARRVGKGKPEAKRRGFKQTYAQGEYAPLSVVTVMPRLLRNVEPSYPPELEELGIEGVVVLRLRIDENGRVAYAKVLKSLHPVADKQAQREVKQLRFSPAKVNDTAVAVEIEYRFNFVLD